MRESKTLPHRFHDSELPAVGRADVEVRPYAGLTGTQSE
jgi:hypothetical protein